MSPPRVLAVKGILSLVLLVALTVGTALAQQRIDPIRLLEDIRVLSADSLEGRAVGSAGGARARHYVQAAFRERGLQSFGEGYEHAFAYAAGEGGDVHGVNVVGYVPGMVVPKTYVVVTAHYDHLGIRNGEIFNGADDNASGVAGLIALADYFRRHPPRHTFIVAALDAEEEGLRGARAFVEQSPVALDRIVLNVNLDMVSRSASDELFVAGTAHTPALKPVLNDVARRSKLHVRFGHDGASSGGEDWTQSSDHGAFHNAGIPFLYFGVEDHPDYHRPTDDFGNIDPAFFIRAVETIVDAVAELDTRLEELFPPSSH